MLDRLKLKWLTENKFRFGKNGGKFLDMIYTTQNLLRITFSFNDLMLKTNRLKKDFLIKIG